jgi:hypothetical protein
MMSDTLTVELDTAAVPAPPEPPPEPAPAKAKAKRGPGRPRKVKTPEPSSAGAASGDRPPSRGPGRPSNSDKLREKLTVELSALGAFVAFLQPADGEVIVRRAPEVADALVKLAETNQRVRRVLEGTLTSSAWLGVAIAVGPLVAELLVNHRVLPPMVGAILNPPAPAANGDG